MAEEEERTREEVPAGQESGETRGKKRVDVNNDTLYASLLEMKVTSKEDFELWVRRAIEYLDPDRFGPYLTVKRLNYIVPSKKNGEKYLLKDFSFFVKPGMMCLVLGSPGGGKTSFFKVLSGAPAKGSRIEGEILFNNHPIDPNTHHRDIGYITQADNHLPTLTVRETLWFSSHFILGPEIPPALREKRLEILIHMLGLKKCENTLIGNEFIRGVSGGEKKRVTIGVDLLKKANLLLMDEPTTGLDSVTSFEVLGYVKSLTNTGRIGVLCALLQPPKEVFELFDHLLLINGGEMSYFGPIHEAISYFSSLGFECPATMSTPEFLQEVVEDPEYFSTTQPPALKTASNFAEAFKNSPHYQDIERLVADPSLLIPQGLTLKDSSGTEKYMTDIYTQFKFLLWRAIKMSSRTPAPLLIRVVKVVLMGVILGTLFFDLGNTQETINMREGLLFFTLTFVLFGSLITVKDLYDQRPVFYEQRHERKWYKTFPYFVAYMVPEFVLTFVEVMILQAVMYWLAGLRGGSRIVFFSLCLYTLELVGTALVTLVSALTPTSFYADTIVPSFLLIFMLTSGYMVPRPNIPDWWIYLYWTSPAKWCFEGLLINELSYSTFTCTESQLVPPRDVAEADYEGIQVCPITSGEQVLASLGFNTGFWWRWIDFVVMCGYVVLFLALAYLALAKVVHRTKHAGLAQDKGKKRKKTSRLEKARMKEEKRQTEIPMPHPGPKGVFFVFKDINYYIKGPKKSKSQDSELQLLSHVTGFVKPGNLLALMGPSGAGKSTLLDVLAMRKTGGRITGEITLSGIPQREIVFNRYAAYVTQTDILPHNSTVREAVTFSAMCRLPREWLPSKRMEFAENILSELRLLPIADTIIGTLGSGISSEQRKRVNIAVELASNPELLLLDEPTSGLDSGSARKLMKSIRRIAKQGRAIISTIHQPSTEIFKMFDLLLLLAPGGKPVYFGPIGDPAEKETENYSRILLDYLSELGFQMEPGRNPADFILEVAKATAPSVASLNVVQKNAENEKTGRANLETNIQKQHTSWSSGVSLVPLSKDMSSYMVKKPSQNILRDGAMTSWQGTPISPSSSGNTLQGIVESYLNSELYANVLREIDNSSNKSALEEYTEKYASTNCTQLIENLRRSSLSILRNPVLLISNILRTIILAVFLGTMFLQLPTSQEGVRSRISLIFFSVALASLLAFAQISSIVEERAVFYHEQASGTYKPIFYGLSMIITAIPIVLVVSLCFTVPAYWISNLDPTHSPNRFLFFFLVYFLTSLSLLLLVQMLSASTPSEGIAAVILGVLVNLFSLFAGFIILRNQIPTGWIWAYWLSLYRYSVEAMSSVIWGVSFYCSPGEAYEIPLPSGTTKAYCPYTSGEEILNSFDLKYGWRWMDVAVLIGFCVANIVLTLICLKKVRFMKS